MRSSRFPLWYRQPFALWRRRYGAAPAAAGNYGTGAAHGLIQYGSPALLKVRGEEEEIGLLHLLAYRRRRLRAQDLNLVLQVLPVDFRSMACRSGPVPKRGQAEGKSCLLEPPGQSDGSERMLPGKEAACPQERASRWVLLRQEGSFAVKVDLGKIAEAVGPACSTRPGRRLMPHRRWRRGGTGEPAGSGRGAARPEPGPRWGLFYTTLPVPEGQPVLTQPGRIQLSGALPGAPSLPRARWRHRAATSGPW